MWLWKPNKKHGCKKGYIWNPSKYACEIDNYSKNIISDLVATWDDIIDVVTKSDAISINFNDKKKATYKMDYSYISHTFSLVAMLLLIIGTIC